MQDEDKEVLKIIFFGILIVMFVLLVLCFVLGIVLGEHEHEIHIIPICWVRVAEVPAGAFAFLLRAK